MNVDKFVLDELESYEIYKSWGKFEKNVRFKNILKHLSKDEIGHYNFWLNLSGKKHFRPRKLKIWFFILVRVILGITFTIKLLERHEDSVVKNYKSFMKNMSSSYRKRLRKIIKEEEYHEKNVITEIKEERVKFTGAIFLGLNDALIEIIGTLAGLSGAIQSTLLIGFAGLITGVAASMSMASSAYLQSKQEENKEPRKYALYTGFSYILIVFILVFPFFILRETFAALYITIGIGIAIVFLVSIYTSVLFDRGLKRELVEILSLSLGITLIAFIIGNVLKHLLNL